MSRTPDSASEGSRNLLQALRVRAERGAEPTFCRFVRGDEEHDIHLDALINEAERWASALKARGVRPGELVLIVAPHDPVLLHAFIGAMIAGAVPAFLPPPTEKQEPEFFWQSIERMTQPLSIAAWILGTGLEGAERFTGASSDSVAVVRSVDLPALPPQSMVWHDPEPDDIAFLQFSSGTTGIRKGVMLTHAQVLEQIGQLHTTLRLCAQDRIVSWLPLYHDMGLIACFILPWVAAVPVVWMSPFEWVRYPHRLFELIERHHGTLAWMPNFAFRHLCAMAERGRHFDLSGMRAFINCSETCKAETFEEFANTFAHCGVSAAQLQTCYAMAEAVFAVTHTEPGVPVRARAFELIDSGGQTIARPTRDPTARVYLSVGRPLAGFELAVTHPSGAPLADGGVGEVRLKGPCLSAGYYRNPQATDAVFRDGWYATGDMGFLHEGELHITGRIKEIIIVHGRNYFAHDIEAVVNTVEGVHRGRAVAIGVHSAQSASEEVVLLVENDQSDPDRRRALTRAIKDALGTQLGLAPRVRFVPPRWLVKTTSGKIDRQSNKRKFLEEGAAHAHADARHDIAHA